MMRNQFRRIILLSMFLLSISYAQAQELNANVTILTPNLQITQSNLIPGLKTAIVQFMNNTRWTNETLNPSERLEINLLFTIKSIDNNVFSGQLQVQCSRPAYGTNYNTTTLNWLDNNLTFTYAQDQPFEYNKGTYISDITSILAFYAYTCLAFDADSYTENGGAPYFAEAASVVNSAQTSNIGGWKYTDKGSRGLLSYEANQESFSIFHKVWYQYHRQGIDMLGDDVEAGRASMLKSVTKLKELYRLSPSNTLLLQFFLCKRDELINLFKQAPSSEKAEAANILKEIDLVNTAKYDTELR